MIIPSRSDANPVSSAHAAKLGESKPSFKQTPATDTEVVNTVLIEYTERLEAVLPDGTEDFAVPPTGRAR